MNPSPRKILVSGATGGIGAGIAQAFAALGDSVTIAGATEVEVKRTADDPAFAGITCQALDVRDAAAVAAVVGGLGELDAVVNCAGVIRRGAVVTRPHCGLVRAAGEVRAAGLSEPPPPRSFHAPLRHLRRAGRHGVPAARPRRSRLR